MYFRTAETNEVQVPGYYKFVLGFSALITIIIGVYPSLIAYLI